MSTTFLDIYDRAIFRFKDYDFMRIDIQSREDILERYLLSSIADIGVVAPDYMQFDYDNKEFFIEDLAMQFGSKIGLNVLKIYVRTA